MDTTPSDSGVSEDTQPISTEAVTDDVAIPITTDENGTPALADPASAATTDATTDASTNDDQADDSAAESTDDAQAPASDKTDDEILSWAEKKGLSIDPKNPTEVKLARMQLENERKFHENNQKPKVQPPEQLGLTGDPNYDAIVERQNLNEMRMYVRDWFDNNPDMKEYKPELSKIAEERPWLQDMEDIKAHFLADPSNAERLKKQGGREALQNLAQKQQQVPPTANATNSAEFQSAQITPQNVYELVDKNDQAWYEKNYAAINKAISGK